MTWTGQRPDVHAIMAALDLYALPSLEESFPLSILEAMAAGLPVVATTVGGVPECVADGETGLLVPPADSDRLADAIIQLATDPLRRTEMGRAGRRRVLERFSAESQTRCIEEVFAGAAQRRRSA